MKQQLEEVKTVWVVAAVVWNAEGQILLAQRPPTKSWAGFWEFPGGKVETGERPEDALCRELEEEIGLQVVPDTIVPFTFVNSSIPSHEGVDDFYLVMLVYEVRHWKGHPEPREGQENIAWVAPKDLSRYTMPDVNYAIVELLNPDSRASKQIQQAL